MLQENFSHPVNDSLSEKEPVLRILHSARQNIEKRGILGLRVAEVARGAESSITQIYRFFGSRDGLLARVLGDLYEEFLVEQIDRYVRQLEGKVDLTVDDLVAPLIPVTSPEARANQELRLQVLAASVNNHELRDRLSALTHREFARANTLLDEIETRLAPGVRIDRRVFTVDIFIQVGYPRHLLGDAGWTGEEYLDYVRRKLSF